MKLSVSQQPSMTQLVLLPAFSGWPVAIASASPSALHAILQFFAAEIRSPNTRRAYLHGAKDFFVFVSLLPGGDRLDGITSLHVSAWLEQMAAARLSRPTLKARLAGLRMLFQVLAREQVIRINPAAVVRGPKHSVKRGKTPVLSADEARQLLDSIDAGTLVGFATGRLSPA